MLRTVIPAFVMILLQTSATSQYYLVFIRPDPARKPLAKEEGERIQSAHMANIRSMAAGGSLVAAGPFGDTPVTIGGIFVLKAASLEAAQQMAANDPTVVEHRNTVDAHVWSAPAGIGEEYFRLHKQDPKTPEGMAARPLVLLLRSSGWTAQTGGLLERLGNEGRLAVAGEIGGKEDLRAVLVFKPGLLDDARAVVEAQPEIRSGAYRAEYHTWWCAAHVLPWETVK